jgi:hypothetical protein
MSAQLILAICAKHPLLVSFAVLTSILIVYQRFLTKRYPANLPLIYEPAGAKRFRLRTRLAFHTDCEKLFRDAYENVQHFQILVACL